MGKVKQNNGNCRVHSVSSSRDPVGPAVHAGISGLMSRSPGGGQMTPHFRLLRHKKKNVWLCPAPGRGRTPGPVGPGRTWGGAGAELRTPPCLRSSAPSSYLYLALVSVPGLMGGTPAASCRVVRTAPAAVCMLFIPKVEFSATFRRVRPSRSWRFARPKIGLWVCVIGPTSVTACSSGICVPGQLWLDWRRVSIGRAS